LETVDEVLEGPFALDLSAVDLVRVGNYNLELTLVIICKAPLLLGELDCVTIDSDGCFSLEHVSQILDDVTSLIPDILEVFLLEVCVELCAVSDRLDDVPNDGSLGKVSLDQIRNSLLHLWHG
jgi:hypothetical protein